MAALAPVAEEAPTWRGNACQGLVTNPLPAKKKEINVQSTYLDERGIPAEELAVAL
jgi:hypothetical protein